MQGIPLACIALLLPETVTIERKIPRNDNILNRMGNSVYINRQSDAAL